VTLYVVLPLLASPLFSAVPAPLFPTSTLALNSSQNLLNIFCTGIILITTLLSRTKSSELTKVVPPGVIVLGLKRYVCVPELTKNFSHFHVNTSGVFSCYSASAIYLIFLPGKVERITCTIIWTAIPLIFTFTFSPFSTGPVLVGGILAMDLITSSFQLAQSKNCTHCFSSPHYYFKVITYHFATFLWRGRDLDFRCDKHCCMFLIN
jgi:hypothetical protein